MSYILDALRRADAERERGAVPGLNTQPTPAMSAPEAAPARARTLWVVVAVLALLLLASLAWQMRGREAPLAPQATAPAPAPAARSFEAPAVAPPVSPAVVANPGVSVATAPTLRPQPAPQAVPPLAPQPAVTTRPVPAPSAPASDILANPPPGAPRLAVGGAIYAEAPANRMLILNGQILHEGERVSPELVLVQIGAKSAVLDWRGTRYQIHY